MKDLARFFNVLSDETRLEMLWLLFNHREICVCDFMAALEITQSKASRHLSTMRHAGLVLDRREGTWSYYSLKAVGADRGQALLNALRSQLAGRARAGEVLDRLHECIECRSHPDRAVKNGKTR